MGEIQHQELQGRTEKTRQLYYGMARPAIVRKRQERERVKSLEEDLSYSGKKIVDLREEIYQGARREERLSENVLTDPLTELPNRRRLSQELTERYALAGRQGEDALKRIVVGIFDLNHFKDMNDTYGHPYGDRFLKELSERFKNKKNIREGEMIGRYGGDEFLIIADIDPTPEHMLKFGERLRSLFDEPVSVDKYEAIPVSASIGLSYKPDREETIKKEKKSTNRATRDRFQQVIRADQAMYEAKFAQNDPSLGRTRLCISPSGRPELFQLRLVPDPTLHTGRAFPLGK